MYVFICASDLFTDFPVEKHCRLCCLAEKKVFHGLSIFCSPEMNLYVCSMKAEEIHCENNFLVAVCQPQALWSVNCI